MRAEKYIREGSEDGHIVLFQQITHPVVIVKTVFIFQYIQSSAADFVRAQGADQSVFINELAAGRIDNDGIVFHQGQGFIIDEMMVGCGRIGMEGDDITLFQQCVKICIGTVFSDCVIGLEIIGQNAAAKAGQMLYDGGADFAGADDTDRTGTDIPAELSFQGIILQLRALENMTHLS